jgi:predicted acylesterase/phospholipase RssA
MDRSPVLIDLALQGGGSHGAFTWGVLDRLLEEPWLRIAGISGTSAGAMNAALLADGWIEGRAEGARAALEKFWRRVSRAAAISLGERRAMLSVVLAGRLPVTERQMMSWFASARRPPAGSIPLRYITAIVALPLRRSCLQRCRSSSS